MEDGWPMRCRGISGSPTGMREPQSAPFWHSGFRSRCFWQSFPCSSSRWFQFHSESWVPGLPGNGSIRWRTAWRRFWWRCRHSFSAWSWPTCLDWFFICSSRVNLSNRRKISESLHSTFYFRRSRWRCRRLRWWWNSCEARFWPRWTGNTCGLPTAAAIRKQRYCTGMCWKMRWFRLWRSLRW